MRYVAGSAVQRLCMKFESKPSPKMCRFFLLMECAGDELNEKGTETWVNMVDCGGLWYVNDLAYGVFVIMEEVTRHYFSINKKDDSRCHSVFYFQEH